MDKVTGLVAATFTPLRADGQVDLERIPGLVSHLHGWDIAGLYINGTTGEGMALSVEERMATAEAYHKAAQGKMKTLIQVGHENVPDAVALTKHAVSLGVDAVSATPPVYFKPSTIEHLLDYLEVVAGAAGNVPFYYYHIPAMTGVAIDACAFLEEAAKRLPNLAGVKYSHMDLATLQACVEHDSGRFDMLFGVDEMLLGAMAMGCRGAVGSTYNFAAPLYHRMIAAFESGDLETARLWQGRSIELVRLLGELCGGRLGLKPLMGLIGQDCGPHRLPNRDPQRGCVEELRVRLEALGFYQWISGEPCD